MNLVAPISEFDLDAYVFSFFLRIPNLEGFIDIAKIQFGSEIYH